MKSISPDLTCACAKDAIAKAWEITDHGKEILKSAENLTFFESEPCPYIERAARYATGSLNPLENVLAYLHIQDCLDCLELVQCTTPEMLPPQNPLLRILPDANRVDVLRFTAMATLGANGGMQSQTTLPLYLQKAQDCEMQIVQRPTVDGQRWILEIDIEAPGLAPDALCMEFSRELEDGSLQYIYTVHGPSLRLRVPRGRYVLSCKQEETPYYKVFDVPDTQ